MIRRLGRYALLKHLATGGMAEIWLARQHGMGGFEKLVVIKRILPHLGTNADFIRMFLDEGRLAARLSHPGIAQIFDLGREGGDFYIAMEFVHGENLRFLQKRIVDAGQVAMPVAYAAKVASLICEALYFAHNQTELDGRPLDLVHRDISPANLILSYSGQPKIVDFGIAKAATQLQETRAGHVKGNYGYMSPEQASGKKLDHRSDLFSLGIVLHELLTGQRLYDHESDLAMIQAICREVPVKPRTIRSSIPSELEAIVLKALEKDPARRFQDGLEMQMALEHFLHGQGAPVTPNHLSRWMRSLFSDRLKAWQRVLQGGAETLSADEVGSISTVFVDPNSADHAAPAPPVEEYDETVTLRSPLAGLEPGRDETVQISVPDVLLAQSRPPAPARPLPEEGLDTAPGVHPHLEPAAPRPAAKPESGRPKAPAAAPPKAPAAERPTRAKAPAAGKPARRPATDDAPTRAVPAAYASGAEVVPGALLLEEDDEDFVPNIALDHLIGPADGPAMAPHGDPSERPVVEVVYTRGMVVLDAAVLRTGSWRPRRGPKMVRLGLGGCKVIVPDGAEATLRRARDFRGELVPARASVVLAENDRIEVREGPFVTRIRFYRPPAPPRSARSPVAVRTWGSSFGLAMGIHVLIFLAFVFGDSVLGIRLPVADPEVAERFATLETPKTDEPAKPKPKPKPRPKPKALKPKPKKPDPTEARPQIPERLRQRIQRRMSNKSTGSGASIVKALTSPVQGEGTTLKEVVSNIDAVKGRGGSSAMGVAGTLAALPEGKGVNLARGGGGEVGTLGGEQVGGSKLESRGPKGRVRGKVSTVRALAKVRGSLSREEVLTVINKHIGQIQGCYERALVKTPNLSGKIEFEWTVRPDGRVTATRERSSTMGNAQVSQCIIRIIGGMKFPKPKGGSVVIAYPFMFRSVPS